MVEGVAVNARTGEALAGVHVRFAAGGIDGISAIYGALSDKSGHFSIGAMQPGTYFCQSELPGFVYSPSASETSAARLVLKPGEKVSGYKLEMSPEAILSGRVVDEYGDPVANVPMQVSAVRPEDQRISVVFGGQGYRTDDRGEFRIVTAPGKFYLKAEPFSGSTEEPEIRTDGTADAVYGPTFYPGAASQEQAAALETKPGGPVTGLEIRLLRQRTFAISGTVTGAPAGSMPMLVVRYGENEQEIRNSRTVVVGEGGRFLLARLAPGYYQLSATYFTPQLRLQSEIVSFHLDGADHNNIDLRLTPGSELTGTLRLEGLPAGKRTIGLTAPDGGNFFSPGTGLSSAEVTADGSFKITGIPPGKYRVAVEPLPESGYLKSVELDGSAVPSGVLDLTGTGRPGRLNIVASGNGAQVSGKLLDKSGAPVAGSMAFVMLLDGPAGSPPQAFTRSAADGTYSLRGVRPGKYRLAAVDAFSFARRRASAEPATSEWYAQSREIEVKEGQKLVEDLKLLGEDAGAKQ